MVKEEARQERFRELVQQHRGIVHKVTATYCFARADRNDLAQEILAQLWRSFSRYDADRPFTTWMYRVALNVAISYVRSTVRRQRHTVPLDEERHDIGEAGTQDLELETRIHALHRFIAAQNDLDRALLLLYLEDYSYREIAEVIGISETNVGTKVNRLKQRIHTSLQLLPTL